MSKIEWTHRPCTKSEVLNPITGCDKISRGCKFCYAEVMHKRLTGMGQPKYQQPFLGHVKFWPDELAKPFKWKKPRTVFLNSMSDIFHKDVTVQQIAQIYAMMALTPKHTYIVLTKRSNRALDVLNGSEFFDAYVDAVNNSLITTWNTQVLCEEDLEKIWPLKNVWQGVSVERQEEDHRIDELANTPAHIRVVSYEPAVGPLDLSKYFGLYQVEEHGPWHLRVGSRWAGSPDWVIYGGESGHKASPAHPDWFRTVRNQCNAAGVKQFFKQWGEWAPDSHVSFNGPFFIHGVDHRLVNIDGKSWPYIDMLSTEEDTCPLTKQDNAHWMAKVGKHASGNFLDGVQHLEFPA